jgi:hypothetical protein
MTIRFSSTVLKVALQDVTSVTFDVGESTGSGLSYRIQYGDGSADTNPPPRLPDHSGPNFFHQYHAVGVFDVRLTVTDQQGRQANAVNSVAVKNLTGTWSNAIQNPSNGLTEARFLTLTQGPSADGFGRQLIRSDRDFCHASWLETA